MKAVIQRVTEADVAVDGSVTGAIGQGLLVLLGVARDDTSDQVEWMAGKCAGLRIFADSDGMMNRSIRDAGGEFLVVSQFTLLADARKGKRPSFVKAAPPDKGELLYKEFIEKLKLLGFKVETGVFGAKMSVHSVNDGPVTIILEK